MASRDFHWINRLPSDVRHEIRNEFYALKLAIHLLNAAHQAGDSDTAKSAFDDANHALESLLEASKPVE